MGSCERHLLPSGMRMHGPSDVWRRRCLGCGLKRAIQAPHNRPSALTQIAPAGAGAVERQCVQRVAKVHDQHLSFIALEAGLFSLGLPNSYLAINDPGANDTQIEVSAQHSTAQRSL